MIKHCLVIPLFIFPILSNAASYTTPPEIRQMFNATVDPNAPLWKDSFIKVTYDKQTNDASVQYNYHVTNIGNVSIGMIMIGYDRNHEGCEVPSENVDRLTTSIHEWTAFLEIQTENPRKCITADTSRDHSLEPGRTLTITAELNKDDPIFENLHWEIIFTRAPTRLYGEVMPAE